MEGLNFVHIIKSFFCCKDEKTEVITACHKYISEEICIEKILKKLHDFENKLDIASENEDLEELKKVIFKNNKKLWYTVLRNYYTSLLLRLIIGWCNNKI